IGAQGRIITKQLIFEMMGKHSNIIFVQDGVIVDALKRIGPALSRVRQILPGQAYLAPPGQNKFNLYTDSWENFWQSYRNLGEISAEKALIQLALGVGPQTAKEWLWQTGLPPKILVNELDEKDLRTLQDIVGEHLELFRQGQFAPTLCLDENNRLLTITALPPAKQTPNEQRFTFSSFSEALRYLSKVKPVRLIPERDLLFKQVTSELQKSQRKKEKLAEEIATSQQADLLKQKGDILMAFLTEIPPHSHEVTLPNFYDENQASLTIPLAPDRSPIDNAQAYYTAYHKQKRAQILLVEQLENCQAEAAYLETIHVALQQVHRNNDIEEIRQELVAAGYVKASGRRQALPPTKPLLYITPSGDHILIGKNNKQNDIVTFKTAKNEDLWFHAKDMPGSHVILQAAAPAPKTIELAASLAAYFSKGKESDKVPVDYTKRRYVKKPSGAKPGFVIYKKQTTVYVTPAREVATELLKQK
ncbi:MAG: NFACT family protein, partial [Sporomusaceae bacterium]|nr:NFACT family protein [Sporomusaceae bacterium]